MRCPINLNQANLNPGTSPTQGRGRELALRLAWSTVKSSLIAFSAKDLEILFLTFE